MIADLKPYPTMEDSGVEWLGEVPAYWEIRRLKQVCRLAYGDALAAEVRKDGVVPVLGSNGRVGLHNAANTKAPCIVIGRKGSFGKVNYSERPVFAIDTTFFVDNRFSSAHIRWLFFLFGWLRLDEVTRDSAVPGLDREDAYQKLIVVPPFSEQAAIVRYLDYADRRIQRYIRAKQKLITLLEEQKQAIIQRAVTRGLDPNVRLKPSGVEWLGKVPTHWERRRLKILLRPVDRRSATGAETLLSLRRDHGIVIYAEHFARPSQSRSLVGFKLVAVGQLVVNRLQANNGLVFCSGINGLVSPDYSVFEMRKPLQMQYLSDLLRISSYRLHFRRESTGLGTGTAGFLRLYDDKFLETEVFLPPVQEQILISNSLANDIAKVKRLMEQQQRQLPFFNEFRTRLITDVVTGKLDVREAASRLPDEVEEPEPLDETDALTDGEEEPCDPQKRRSRTAGSTFCGAQEVPTGEGDVGERVATLEQSFASESMMHHYNLSTRHVFQTRRSDIRSETLAASRSTIEVATRGHAVLLPGFPEHFLSIRNTWLGAVGWLIQGPEHRVMVQCVTAWMIEGAAKGVRWLGTELPEELDLPCCLVKLGLPLLKDPDSASWLEDAERCISWAMLPTPPLGNGTGSP